MAAGARVLRANVALEVGRIGKYLRTVLAGIFSDVSMRNRTVPQVQFPSTVRSVTEFARKCSGRLCVLRYQVTIENIDVREGQVTVAAANVSVFPILVLSGRKGTGLLD